MSNHKVKQNTKNINNNPSYIFPFKNIDDFDYSDNQKLKMIQQDNAYNYNDNSSSNSNNDASLNLEQTLSNFYDYSLDSYKKKMYDNLIKEIEANEYLYYIGSREAFDILVIKVKCLMKLMIEKYDSDLKDLNEAISPPREYILRIQNEFAKIDKIINAKDKYEYEVITQIYCKFLIYLIKFAQKKEEFCKSLAYITLGINMMKIYFVKRKMTTEIKSYKRYIYLLILLINQLIGEKNFKQALLYCDNLLKIIEMSIKVINKIKSKNVFLNFNKKIIDLYRCSGIAYMYIGMCFENQKNSYPAIEAYRQSTYFFKKIKSPKFINIRLRKEKISYDRNFLKISNSLMTRQKTKIEEDRRRIQERLNMNFNKNQNDDNANDQQKNRKLKLISSGLYGDQKKLNLIENKIYKNILTPKNQKLISNLDRALISLAFPEKRSEKKKRKLKKSLSLSTMDSLCHYEMYNKLMSKNYHNFIMENNNLKLSNPRDQEDFISKIHSYLTSTMEIKSNNNKNNKSKEKNSINLLKDSNRDKNDTLKKSFSTGNLFKTNGKPKISSAKTPRKPQFPSYQTFDSPNIDLFCNKNIKSSRKFILKKNNSCASLKLDIPKSYNNNYNYNYNSRSINRSLSETYITSRTTRPVSNYLYRQNSKTRTKLSSYTDFGKSKKKNLKYSEIKEKQKHYLTPKYFKKYMYLDKLAKKELDFQKVILSLKANNSKLYYNRFQKELFIVGKDQEEEMNQNYMLINEKIDQKVLKSQKEYEKMLNNNSIKKQDGKSYRNSLKRNNGQNFFKSYKNVGSNLEFDFFDNKKKSYYEYYGEEEEDAKKVNEKSIFALDEQIKNIKNKINERKAKLKNH